MGSHYHSYVVVGVRASEILKQDSLFVEYQNKLDGKPLFDQNGKPIMGSKSHDYILFQDKKYSFGFLCEKLDGKVCDDLFIKLKEFGLQWISHDYNGIYDNDVVGIVVDQNNGDSTGIDLKCLAETFDKARKVLKSIGCETEPRLYAAFHHSY